MLLYKCDYCGAEILFDGSQTVCPACGAALKTGAQPKDPADITPTPPPVYEGDPDEEYEPPEADYFPSSQRKNKKKRSTFANVVIGVFATVGILFTLIFVAAMIDISNDEAIGASNGTGDGNSGHYDEIYKEEGHTPGEAYTGDITLEADISDYNVISWSEEPKLQWGANSYDCDTLSIHGKVHNNSDKDIRALSFSFDIVWKDGAEPKYMSASVYDLFALQDEYIDESVYIYEPKTFEDIKEIKITEVRISYE
jgi:hypothetical protein